MPLYLAWHALHSGSLKTVLADIHQSAPFELSIQYPHRQLLAPRVRAVMDDLLEALKRDNQLNVGEAALGQFAAGYS